MDKTYEFKDVTFMTAGEKELVVRRWEQFLKSDCLQSKFNRKLYNHLHMHCGFIAHYNIHGFYETYFMTAVDKETFFRNFVRGSKQGSWGAGEYEDINNAMLEIYNLHADKLSAEINEGIKTKLERLQLSIDTAKDDPVYARRLLTRLGL